MKIKHILSLGLLAGALTAGVLAFDKNPSQAQEASQGASAAMTKEQIESIVEAYIKANPQLIIESVNEYQRGEQEREQQKAVETLKKNMSFFTENKALPHIGKEDKPDLVVANVFDYNCGFCKKATPDIVKLHEEYGSRIKIVFLEYPIFGGDSDTAARYALAANKQGKYFEFHQAMMQVEGGLNEARMLDIATGLGLNIDQLKKDKDSEEVTKALTENRDKGTELGIRGTPAFIIGTQIVRGAVGYEQMKEAIDSQLK